MTHTVNPDDLAVSIPQPRRAGTLTISPPLYRPPLAEDQHVCTAAAVLAGAIARLNTAYGLPFGTLPYRDADAGWHVPTDDELSPDAEPALRRSEAWFAWKDADEAHRDEVAVWRRAALPDERGPLTLPASTSTDPVDVAARAVHAAALAYVDTLPTGSVRRLHDLTRRFASAETTGPALRAGNAYHDAQWKALQAVEAEAAAHDPERVTPKHTHPGPTA